MRLFVAIDVPENIKEHLAFLQRSLTTKIRLIHPKNIHLTLNFLGERDNIDHLIEQLKTVRFHPFQLRLKDQGFFPTPLHPRVLWIGLEDNHELLHLQRQIDMIFMPDKSFKPHLTLARIRHLSEQERLQLIKEAEQLPIKSLSFKVTSFRLYKSTLTPLGPVYEVLETFRAT